MVDFARKLDAMLTHYNLSRFAFSKKIGVDPTSITNYMEKGAVPTYRTINSILDTFPEISAEWLLRDSGDMFLDGTTPVVSKPKEPTPVDNASEKFQIEELKAEVAKLSARNELLLTENSWVKKQLDDTKTLYSELQKAYIRVTMK